MAHGFKEWRPETTGAADIMDSISQDGYSSGDIINADNVNAPIKQANGIGIGLIDALGIETTTLNADSSASDIARAINTALTNKVGTLRALSATQLTISAGGNDNPVYFNTNGQPVACNPLYLHTFCFDLPDTGHIGTTHAIGNMSFLSSYSTQTTPTFNKLCEMISGNSVVISISGSISQETTPYLEGIITNFKQVRHTDLPDKWYMDLNYSRTDLNFIDTVELGTANTITNYTQLRIR